MKVVLLAGGAGTRIQEESEYKPKPMIEIGGMPILWHIMKEYSFYGHNEFIICAGYKQEMIKKWFGDYFLYTSDVTFDFTKGNEVVIHNQKTEPWKVTVVDTGVHTMTAGRLRRIRKYVEPDQSFLMTYGDGVCDVDINSIIDFHKRHGKKATLTSVTIDQTKGTLDIAADYSVRSFREKQNRDATVINAGYMVLNSSVFEYMDGDDCVLEKDVLSKLASEGELMSYNHSGFWQCMDTMKEKNILEKMIESGNSPWVHGPE